MVHAVQLLLSAAAVCCCCSLLLLLLLLLRVQKFKLFKFEWWRMQLELIQIQQVDEWKGVEAVRKIQKIEGSKLET